MHLDRRQFVKTGVLAACSGATASAEQPGYLIGAYYFPNFHVDPRNEQIYGTGWTEWEILKRGEPKFHGHLQPKRPLWGYEDESRPVVFERKISAAHAGGLNHFIFDWYWYEGKPFLNRALENGYQRAGNKDKVRFCLMWANHDWYNLMPAHLHEHPAQLLYKGTYSPVEFDAVADYILEHYFRDPSYFLVDGAPYFSIYKLQQLIDRMGGLEVAGAAFQRWRDKLRASGFRDLHLNAVTTGIQTGPELAAIFSSVGVRSVTSYTWAHHYDLRRCSFPSAEYSAALSSVPAYWEKAAGLYGVPYHVDISMGWDPSPRACQSDKYERGSYPFSPVLANNSPELFRRALAQAKAHLDSHPGQPRIVTINAWNEWTEGSYLEPDSIHGMGYLDAIRSVFGA